MADEDKQFEATPHKLKKAREEGQVYKSKDLSTAIFLIAMFSLLIIMAPLIWHEIAAMFILLFDQIPNASIEKIGWQYVALVALKALAILVAPFLVIGVIVAIFMDFVQVGPLFATKSILPKIEKLNPVKGFKNIFSMKTVVELVKNIIKMLVLGVVGYLIFMEYMDRLLLVGAAENIFTVIGVLGDLIMKFVLVAGIAFFVIGGADWLFQRWKFLKDQKMSFKELKDEFKNTEGDPMIKQALRQRRMQMMQQSMLEAVPSSDVVVTNPIHIAVAIKYNAEDMEAPQVVAKGAELFAERIKEIAEAHSVPVVENVTVARTLYRLVDIDQEVPPDIYQAVAEILLFAWKISGKEVPVPNKRGNLEITANPWEDTEGP